MEPAPAEPSRTPDPGFAGRPFPGLEPPSPVLGALSPVTPPVAHSGLGCVGRCVHAACLRARSSPPTSARSARSARSRSQERGCRWHSRAGRATPPPLPPPPPLASRGLRAASAPAAAAAAAAAAACDSPPPPPPPLSFFSFIYLFISLASVLFLRVCARGLHGVLGQELARVYVCVRARGGRACPCPEGAPSLGGSGRGVQKRKIK